jgi:hypothetical protein
MLRFKILIYLILKQKNTIMKKTLFNSFMQKGIFLSFAFLLTTLFVSNTARAQYVVDFEAETSGGYASETVNLNGLDWDLTQSLIGNSASDFKNGLKSLRMRGYGTSSFTMLQDKPNGIGTISFLYSEYGTDTQTSWRVEYSSDAGANWTQIGADFTAIGGNLNPETFSATVNVLGNARIRIIEATGSGESNRRMNIDDISITDYVAVIPTITATPSSLTGFTQFVGSPSAEQTFEVSGTLLTGDITLTVTSGDYQLSETAGGIFGNTITLTQMGGQVTPTTIYLRLNGTTATSPANGVVTLTSAGATNVIVTSEGQILNPAPTIFVSETALTGFSHFVGTPSAEQTFEVSGSYLTNDIVITAPAEYEVSLTSGAGFAASLSLTPNNGAVANSMIYVRLNGASGNANQVGDLTVASVGAADQTISLSGETLAYNLTTIGAATTIDANGVGESVGNLVELRGIVHCIDFRGGNGYNVTVIDGAGDGIQLFSFNQVAGYESTEGDSLQIFGTISQFNGLLQINAADIVVISQGNPTVSPVVVSALDESSESQLVALENLTFVTPTTTWPTNGNVDVTDGTSIFTVRVVSASPLSNTAAPTGAFNITGLGGQFDNSSPFASGYQIFPCSVEELCNLDATTTTTDVTIEANATGLTYQWVDCDNNYAVITNETNQSFTPTVNGNYAVVLTDGACSDTSECVTISTIGLNEGNSFSVSAYPNPVNDVLTIQAADQHFNMTVLNLEGKVLATYLNVDTKLEMNTSSWSKGIYTVLVSNNATTKAIKIVK